MPERPPDGFLEPEYGSSDIQPDVTHADAAADRLPEAFLFYADLLGASELPFAWEQTQVAADYTGRAPFDAMLRGHIYRLGNPDLGSHHAVASHLDAQPRVADALGFETTPGRDTFRRFWNDLDGDTQEVLTGHAAALRREVAASGVAGSGALEPKFPDDDTVDPLPGEKARAVEHLRSFCYEQLSFNRASGRNLTYHRDDILDLQAEVSRELGFVQGTIEDRTAGGESCHAPRTHFNAIENRDTDEWRTAFEDVFEMQIQAAKNAGLFQRPVGIHIDATIIPYYKRGPTDELPEGVTGNVKARGTHYGYKHVTVSAQDNGRSVLLASFDAKVRDNLDDAVKYLVQRADEHINIDTISMDSEFGKMEIAEWLDDRGHDFIVHLPRKGKRLKRALVQFGGKFDAADYKYGKSKRKHRTVEGTVMVERDYDVDEPDGPEPGDGLQATNLGDFGGGVDHSEVDLGDIDDAWWRRWRPYFTNMDVVEDDVEATIRRYKRRWSIETKYRVIKHEFLGRTTSRKYVARTFFWLFACMLYNAWVLLDVFLRADYPDLVTEDRPAMAARTFAKQFFQVEPD